MDVEAGPPAAVIAEVRLVSVWSAATVPSSAAPLLSWTSSTATMSGVARLVTMPVASAWYLAGGSFGAKFSTL